MKVSQKFLDRYCLPKAEVTLDQQGFTCFELSLSARERLVLAELKIGTTAQYDNFAASPAETRRDLSAFFSLVTGNETGTDEICGIIQKIRQQITAGFTCKSHWMSIRAWQPTADYDVPRWHQDGAFYDHTGHQFKIAAALKGAPTRFIKADKTLRTEFNQLKNREICKNPAQVQSILNRFMQDKKLAEIPDGQAIIFKAGGQDAAIHSEPPINTARLFISLVPGTRNQIEQIRQRWNMPPSVIEQRLK